MLKLLSFLATVFFATSCSSVRHFVAPGQSNREKPVNGYQEQGSANSPSGSNTGIQGAPAWHTNKMTLLRDNTSDINIENSNLLQFKYSIFINVPVEKVSNPYLLSYMDEWYGTPYRYGGSTKSGVDCSAFSVDMLVNVFGISIPRTVREQYQVSRRINRNELFEGDLVFFNTTGGISHVGVYLANNKFIHASTSSGVMISDLADPYFEKRYVGAGRVRE